MRALKSRGIRSFAFVAPPVFPRRRRCAPSWKARTSATSIRTTTAAIAKTRRSTRSRLSRAEIKAALEKAANEAQIIGESQNFTRDLVNEPSNRMTPTILAERAKKMSAEVGLKCEVFGADKIKEMKMGAFWSVAQGFRRTARAHRHEIRAGGRAGKTRAGPGRERELRSTPAASRSSPPTAWRR